MTNPDPAHIADHIDCLLPRPHLWGTPTTGSGIYVVGRLSCHAALPADLASHMGQIMRQIIIDGIFKATPFDGIDPRMPARFPVKLDTLSIQSNTAD